MITVYFRTATPADIPLLDLWDQKPHVSASDPDDGWGWDRLLGGALAGLETYICEVEGRPVGVVQILDTFVDASRYWGDTGPGFRALDIWIGPEDALGKGYGTAMIHKALSMCFLDATVHTVLIDPLVSNTDAIRFYQRVGFVFLENRWFDESHCAVHRFTRHLFEKSNP
jgi:aminoglycoside 6'-N-acetyltransferase